MRVTATVDDVGTVGLKLPGSTDERTKVDEDALEIGACQHDTVLGQPVEIVRHRVPT